MNKCRFWLIVLLLGLVAVFSVGATGGTPELKVQKALGVTGGSDVYNIPIGSTVTHLPDGSTTIIGPDGNLVISVKSSEVGLIPTTQGMAKATRVYEVPSGSFVHGASPDTIEVYDADGKLILTVIEHAGEAGLEAVQTMAVPYTGWVECARYGYLDGDPHTSFTHFQAEWVVPAAPVNSWIDNDVVGLFNGIQGNGAYPWNGWQVILQPVVAHNEDGAWWPGNPLNGRVWVTSDLGAYCTDAIGVSVGQRIYGAMHLANPAQPLWEAVIYNENTGNFKVLTTDLLGTTSQFIVATLEGINLEADNKDLFGTTYFTNMVACDQNGGTICPTWHKYIDPRALNYFTGLDVVIYDCSCVKLQTAR